MGKLAKTVWGALKETKGLLTSWERTLYVFDFDDTLVRTGSLIYVQNEHNPHSEFGTFFALTPGEFAVYEPRAGDEFDFSDFKRLVDPEEISWTLNILRRVVRKHGKDSAVILTARGAAEPVREFLRDRGLEGVQVRALDDGHPERKSNWIAAVIRGLGFVNEDEQKFVALDRLNTGGTLVRFQFGVSPNP